MYENYEEEDLEREKDKEKALERKIKAVSFTIAGLVACGVLSFVIVMGLRGNSGAPQKSGGGKQDTKAEKLAKKADKNKGTPAVSGKGPQIAGPILFNTPEADAILKNLQIFPKDNPWNEDISALPVHPNSINILENCDPKRKLGYNLDMGFVIVPPGQKKIDVKIVDYPGESDKGPYPVPDNMPVEGWPMAGGSLDNIQRNGNGDRHSMVLDPANLMLYEFYITRKTDEGWQCAQASIFDLKTNKTRPPGWTSCDAAGLPVMPAAVRYDDVMKGVVPHALRVTFKQSRASYVWPATHYASRLTGSNYIRMGDRVRLKASVDISEYSPHPKAILAGLKKYGAFMADNGMNWLISVTPDERFKDLDEMFAIHGSDFELIVPTGKKEGPRAK